MPLGRQRQVLPFSFQSYFQPYLFLLSSILIQALFILPAASQANDVVCLSAMRAICGMNILSSVLFTDTQDLRRAALLDPFGYYTVTEATRYWTITEKNHAFIPFQGVYMLNRILWIAVAAALLHWLAGVSGLEVPAAGAARKENNGTHPLLFCFYQFAGSPDRTRPCSQFEQVLFFRAAVCKRRFKVAAVLGYVLFAFVVIFFTNASYADQWYGSGNWPLTYVMLDVINVFSIYMYAVIVFYSGELIWRRKTCGLIRSKT